MAALEAIRPKTGAILAALRRLYGAEVYALPIFESQQYVVGTLSCSGAWLILKAGAS